MDEDHRRRQIQCRSLRPVASNGLRPLEPIAECVRSDHSIVKECQRLAPDIYDDCVTSKRSIRSVGCRWTSDVIYVTHVGRRTTMMANETALAEH